MHWMIYCVNITDNTEMPTYTKIRRSEKDSTLDRPRSQNANIGWAWPFHVDGLVQDCSNSIANALELLQSCPKPSI